MELLYVKKLSYVLLYIFQGTLEFTNPDPKFHVQKPGQGINVTAIDYDIFGHGGMIFWLTSSLFFFVVREDSLFNE